LPNLTRFAFEGRDALKQLDQAGLSALGKFEDAFAAIMTGAQDAKTAFADMARAILSDLMKMIIRMQITAPLAAMLGGGGGSPLNLLGFGGFRDAGGPVQPGRAYVVGERRPELFVPGSSGQIIPNLATAAPRNGPMDFNITVQVQGVGDSDLLRKVEAGTRAAAQDAIRQYDRNVLPDRVGVLGADRRRRY
jgi:hypothetical protein